VVELLEATNGSGDTRLGGKLLGWRGSDQRVVGWWRGSDRDGWWRKLGSVKFHSRGEGVRSRGWELGGFVGG
jgi:hypothetical protein